MAIDYDTPVQFGELHRMNTGCHYSPLGQPITWATFDLAGILGVVYHDHARGITRAIALPGETNENLYGGVVTPHVIHGDLGSDYVRTCEKLSLHHANHDTYWAESKFFRLARHK